MPPQPLSPGWQAICRCQQYADSNKLTPATFAVDEALTDLISDRSVFAEGHDPDAAEVERRFSSLTRNRRSKHLRRAELTESAARYRTSFATGPETRAASDVDNDDLLSHLRAASNPADWQLIEAHAVDALLNVNSGLSAGAMRNRLCRARKRMRAAA